MPIYTSMPLLPSQRTMIAVALHQLAGAIDNNTPLDTEAFAALETSGEPLEGCAELRELADKILEE